MIMRGVAKFVSSLDLLYVEFVSIIIDYRH